MQIVQIFAADAHRHFDRREIAVGHDADMNDIADGDALKADRRAILEAGGISKYERSSSLRARGPPLAPDMRRINPTSTAEAASTNAPTLSCDHCISLRLGTAFSQLKMSRLTARE